MARVKFTTTLDSDVLKKLELLKVEKGLSGKNDVIELLTTEYWGIKNDNREKSSRSKESKRISE